MTDSVRTAVRRLARNRLTTFSVSDVVALTHANPALVARLLVDLVGTWSATSASPAFELRRVGRGAYEIIPADAVPAPSTIRPALPDLLAPEVGSTSRARPFVRPPVVPRVSPDAVEAIRASAARMREALNQPGFLFASGPTAPPKWYHRGVLGRLRLYFEPRDLWVGAYVAREHVYVCPLPTVVIRYARRSR